MAAAPSDIAIGNAPSAIARLVIRIGRKRIEEAWITASAFCHPRITLMVGKFHDQDTILRYQPYQHNYTNLREDIPGLVKYP